MKIINYLVLVLVICLSFQTARAQSSERSVDTNTGLLFSFGLIADPQYADADMRMNRYYRNSLEKIENCVNELNTHDLAFVVTLGDMIDRDYSSYDKILPILKNSKSVVYNVLGNHDFSVDDKYKAEVRRRMGNERGYFVFSVGDFDFIVLDGSEVSSFASEKGSKKYKLALALQEELKEAGLKNSASFNGAIGSRQLKWLDKRLKESTKADRKAILFCHFPLLPESGLQLYNNLEVLKIINNHQCVVAWISGHNHEGAYHKSGDIHHLTIKGMIETEHTGSYGIMEVYPDKLFLKGYGDQEDLNFEFTGN